MSCSGNSKDHCCIYGGVVCKYLEIDTMPGRHWVCGLMRELGDWDLVIASPEYQKDLVPLYEKYVWPHSDVKYNCKTWPSHNCDCRGN
jgi:hypothetical protein